MPIINIKSLPFESSLDVSNIIEKISNDFSEKLEIDAKHITVTWEFLSAGYYSVAGEVVSYQPANSHPILVDLLAPDFNSKEAVVKMFEVISASISHHTPIRKNNIFINYREAHSGLVYDAGEVVQW